MRWYRGLCRYGRGVVRHWHQDCFLCGMWQFFSSIDFSIYYTDTLNLSGMTQLAQDHIITTHFYTFMTNFYLNSCVRWFVWVGKQILMASRFQSQFLLVVICTIREFTLREKVNAQFCKFVVCNGVLYMRSAGRLVVEWLRFETPVGQGEDACCA